MIFNQHRIKLNLNKEQIFLIVIIVSFIAIHLIALLTMNYFFDCEETKESSLGYDLIFRGGLKLPFFGYLDSPHSGGCIIAGLSSIPFYLLIGSSFFSFKMTALFFSTLSIIFWYLLIRKNIKFNWFLVSLFVVLFGVGTPHYLQKTLILLGNGDLTMFFNVLIIYLFYKINKSTKNIFLKFFLLGIFSGISIWGDFKSSLLIITIILVLFIINSLKDALKKFLSLLIGIFIGLIPFFIYNLLYDWATFTADYEIYDTQITYFSIKRLILLITVYLPRSFHFLNIWIIKGMFLSYALYSLFIFSFVMLIVKNLSQKRRHNNFRKINLDFFLILYFLVYIIFISQLPILLNPPNANWDNMNPHYGHYLIPLTPLMLAIFMLVNRFKSKLVVGIDLTIVLILILGLIGLYIHNPAQKYNLFLPHFSTGADATKSGMNYVNNPVLFFKFKSEIREPRLIRAYYKGAHIWLTRMPPVDRIKLLNKAKSINYKYYIIYKNITYMNISNH